MDQVPPNSFVPRASAGPVVQAPLKRHRRHNILSFFAVILFFGTLILAAGVFAMKQMSETTLQERQQELSSKRALFKREDIESVQILDARIKAATALLESHVSPTKLLEVLERTTQEEIQYTTFDFTRRPSGNVGVAITGVAPRFNTVARQAQRFADETLFRRVIFSNLNKPSQTHVSFSVDLDIAREAIAYQATPSLEEATDALNSEALTDFFGSTTPSVTGAGAETVPSSNPNDPL